MSISSSSSSSPPTDRLKTRLSAMIDTSSLNDALANSNDPTIAAYINCHPLSLSAPIHVPLHPNTSSPLTPSFDATPALRVGGVTDSPHLLALQSPTPYSLESPAQSPSLTPTSSIVDDDDRDRVDVTMSLVAAIPSPASSSSASLLSCSLPRSLPPALASLVSSSSVPRFTPPRTATSPTAASSIIAPAKIAWRHKLVLVLVGLPARGKSYIAYKLMGYLRWRGLNANMFNVGKHRRVVAEQMHASQSSDYFSSSNVEAKKQRDQIAMEVLDDMLLWLRTGGGDVSIFDATNTTSSRRSAVLARCKESSPDLRVIFLESICDDARVLDNNYRVKVTNSPDYKNMDVNAAMDDLRSRVANYEKIYETIADDALSYIKMHNISSKIICNRIHGALCHSIAAYLMSIHVQPRPLFFVRAGHSEMASTERGEAGEGLVGQQFADRQILNLPDHQQKSAQASSSSSSSSSSAFHIPYNKSTAANLAPSGKAFASRLSRFIANKVDEYTAKLKIDELDAATSSEQLKEQAITQIIDEDECADRIDQHDYDASYPSLDISIDPSLSSSSIPPPLITTISDSPLSPSVSGAIDHHLPLVVYTSTLPRAIQTAYELRDSSYTFESTSSLNMMDTGMCTGMSIEEIRAKMPEELIKWQKHKYHYRFPGGGESQSDRARSLEPLVFELERQTLPVLIVSHMSTLQVLLGFFYGSSRNVDSYYSLWLPQHVVLELRPHQYGWTEVRHDISEEACKDDYEDRERCDEGGTLQVDIDDSSKLQSPAAAAAPSTYASIVGRSSINSGIHPTAPVHLGCSPSSADEVERFNLQPYSSSSSSSSSSVAADNRHRASTTVPVRIVDQSTINMIAHDRSISVPSQCQTESDDACNGTIITVTSSSSSSSSSSFAASSSSSTLSSRRPSSVPAPSPSSSSPKLTSSTPILTSINSSSSVHRKRQGSMGRRSEETIVGVDNVYDDNN